MVGRWENQEFAGKIHVLVTLNSIMYCGLDRLR
jgi:hypothetical protein